MTGNFNVMESRIMIIEGKTLPILQDGINEYCKGKFVVGIQYPDKFQEGFWRAVISYKVKQE